jgi:prefoldin subunit 5
MITVTNNSPQQINAAILALIRQIEKLEKDYKDLQNKIKELEDTNH